MVEFTIANLPVNARSFRIRLILMIANAGELIYWILPDFLIT